MAGHVYGREGVQRTETEITETLIRTTQPAIIIGLGGTGKEVLLRLRQRFFEKYGEPGLPTMAYLWLDTDMGDYGIVQGKPMDYIQREAHFHTGEYIDCQVETAAFQEYFNNPNRHLNVWDWLYPQLQAFGQVQHGAAQTPPLGRLAFFNNFSDIKQSLENIEKKIYASSARKRLEDEYKMSLENESLKVIVVSSLAGGTGNGMLLDTTFLVRHLLKARNPEIVGYLLLPGVFGSVTALPRVYANAYAKLKELEFYSLRREYLLADKKPDGGKVIQSVHDFAVDWTGTHYPGTPIVGPPFNNCYFIDNETESGGSIDVDHITDICDMISESIFIDFSADAFSARKRMVRVNLNAYLNAVIDYEFRDSNGRPIHTDVYACSFSTFGFSMINVPLDRIRKTCGYHLAVEITDYWLRRNSVAGNLRSQIEDELLSRLELRQYRQNDDYFKLLSKNDEAGTTFQKLINDSWARIKSQFQNQVLNGGADLSNFFSQKFSDFQQQYFDEQIVDQEPRGEFIRRLLKTNNKVFLEGKTDANGAVLQLGAKRRLRQLLAELLETHEVGISAAIEHLEILGEIFTDQADVYQKLADSYKQNAENTREEIDRLLQGIADEEKTTFKKRSLRAGGDVICQRAAKYFNERIAAVIYEQAHGLALALQAYVGKAPIREEGNDDKNHNLASGLISDLWRLEERLKKMNKYFIDQRKSFGYSDKHLIFQTLYPPEMYKEYYYQYDAGGNKVEIKSKEMKDKLYADVGWRSLLGILADIDNHKGGKVQDQVEIFCINQFHGFRLDIDVVEKLNKSDRKNHLSNLVKNGAVWLRRDDKAKAESNIASYVDDVVIGLHQGTDERYGEIESEIRESLNNVKYKYKCSIGKAVDVDKQAILLYSEYAGFPIPYIHGLPNYYTAYYQEIRGVHDNGRHFPHISRKNTGFPEVIIDTQENVENLLKVNKILFIGSILRILKLETSSGPDADVEYSFEEHTALSHDRNLGDRRVAQNVILNDPVLMEDLERRVNEARAKLSLDARQKLYTILGYYIVQKDKFADVPEGPYPPVYVEVGGIELPNFSSEHIAIAAIYEKEEQKLISSMSAYLQGMVDDGDMEDKKQAMEFLFQQWYQELDDFTETIKVDGKKYRYLKTLKSKNSSSAKREVGYTL